MDTALTQAMNNVRKWGNQFGFYGKGEDKINRGIIAPIPDRDRMDPGTGLMDYAQRNSYKPTPNAKPVEINKGFKYPAWMANAADTVGNISKAIVTPTPSRAPQTPPINPVMKTPVGAISETPKSVVPTVLPGQDAFIKDMMARSGGNAQKWAEKYRKAVTSPGWSGKYYGGATPTPTPAPARVIPEGKVEYKGAVIVPPPPDIAKIIKSVFGPLAQDAAAVAYSENGSFNPVVENKANADGSIDRGIFQINSNTFNGLMKRKPQLLERVGVNSFEDMYDPIKNTLVAKIVYDEGGWGRWFGPSRIGLTL